MAKTTSLEQCQSSLQNALTGISVVNYSTIIRGFSKKGIPTEQILPRENVFTFNAWKALGRTVRRGEHGVKVIVIIKCEKTDPVTGEKTKVRKGKTATVFHVSQTEPITGEQNEILR